MEVPVRWLKEFVETDMTADEIAHRLTMAGLEAEKITRIGENWDKIFVGHVDSVDPHPNADRLVLATVTAGEHHLTVVTGAPNIAAGQKVPLAIAGAELIDAYAEEPKLKKLKPSSIRGVHSEGMVCSEKELGLSEEHEGILVLEDDAPLGMSLRDWLGDEVIEFEITPNLVHAYSILGIARELAALVDEPVRQPEVADLDDVPCEDSRVDIQAPDLCGRFTMTVIENVTVGPSPAWLQRRLISAGMRPVNNYVDISNYVMAEIGHPNHPFDADRLASDEIVVRRAKPGEKLTTIDHIERELSDDMLVIADRERAVGIAGIMGGEDTEISERTSRVLLESAWFEPKTIRSTSRKLKLQSDASARFGRDIDPNAASVAAARFVELVRAVDPDARVAMQADAFLRPRQRREVSMPFSEIERLLGMTIPLDDAGAILSRLDMEPSVVESNGRTTITTSVPTYRNDVNQPADLVEEVVRVYGYETLPETLPTGQAVHVNRDPARMVDQATQDTLVAAGLYQVQTYTMINEDDLRALSTSGNEIPDVLGGYPRPEVDYVRASNPLRTDWVLMRPSLIPSLLKTAGENRKFNDRVAIFETARTYQPIGLDQLPDEHRAVGIVLTGSQDEFSLYDPEPAEFDFFDIKGVVETLVESLGASDAQFVPIEHPSLHPGRAAAVEVDGTQVGMLGEVNPRISRRFGIEGRTCTAEIDLAPFIETLLAGWNVTPVGRYQPVEQDFAVVVDEATPAGAVEETISQSAGALATGIKLFDIYRGSSIGDGKKSLAYRVTLSAPDRQIAEHEIDRVRTKIEQNVGRKVGGSLRS